MAIAYFWCTDFLVLFHETAWLLDADPTIWCISSWVNILCVSELVLLLSAGLCLSCLGMTLIPHPISLDLKPQNDNGIKTDHVWNATRLVRSMALVEQVLAFE